MTSLVLTAVPTVVAHEKLRTVREDRAVNEWEWLIEADQRAMLAALVKDGKAGTAHRREDGGAFVLVAWDVGMQRQAALEAARLRKLQAKDKVLTAETPEYTPRVYRPQARPVGMQTYAPFMFEPARW